MFSTCNGTCAPADTEERRCDLAQHVLLSDRFRHKSRRGWAQAQCSMDIGCILAAPVFIAHIVGNLTLSGTGPRIRLYKLSIFPPPWVFAIWLVIWGLQTALLVRSYHSTLWTLPVTSVFVLTCVGNLGSQLAGARNWGAVIYLAFLSLMLGSAVAFWLVGASNKHFRHDYVFQAGAQLYVGWGAIALVVGTGAVLVCDWQSVSDASYSRVGMAVLFAVPLVVWSLWLTGVADARIVSTPFFWVLFAFATRPSR